MAIVPGLGIGVGLLIIITTWVGTFGISFIFLFFDRIRKLAIPITLLTAVVLTCLLLLPLVFERNESNGSGEVDYLYVVRIVFFILLSISCLVSVSAVSHSILLEPRYASNYRRIVW